MTQSENIFIKKMYKETKKQINLFLLYKIKKYLKHIIKDITIKTIGYEKN